MVGNKLLAVVALAWSEILAGTGRALRKVKLDGSTVGRMLDVAASVRDALAPAVVETAPADIEAPIAAARASSRKRGPYKKRKGKGATGNAKEKFCGDFARHSYKPGATACSRCGHKRRGAKAAKKAKPAKASKPKSKPKAKAKPAPKKAAKPTAPRRVVAPPAPAAAAPVTS